jgi:hypothetical protein
VEHPVSQLQYSRYLRLIEYAKLNPAQGRVEKHHIVPRSFGGSDKKENIVPLPLRLHFLAHWLLWKAYKDSRMANAFWTMACCHGVKLNSKTYATVRDTAVKAIAKAKFGKTTSDRQKLIVSKLMSGRVVSVETRQKLSAANIGRKLTAEHIAKLSAIKIGKKASNETRLKMSLAKKGKKPNNWLGHTGLTVVTPPLPWTA